MERIKKELEIYFENLYPLDIGLIFKIYRRSDSDEIQFKIPVGNSSKNKRNLLKNNLKNERFKKVLVNHDDFVKYIAVNILKISNKDIGFLPSKELYNIFVCLKKILDFKKLSIELKNRINSIVRYHIIYVLGSSINSKKRTKIIIDDIIDLLLEFDIKIDDIFYNIQYEELIQIYNLTYIFLKNMKKIGLNKDFNKKLESLISKLINLCEIKIKKHLNLMLRYLSVNPEYLKLMEDKNWLDLLNSNDTILLNEDILLYFFLKNLHHFNTSDIFGVVRFDYLSDFGKDIYEKYCKSNYSSINRLFNQKEEYTFPRNGYLNNKYYYSSFLKNDEKPVITSINDEFQHLLTNNNVQISYPNKTFIINQQINNINYLVTFEVHFKNKLNHNFHDKFNELFNFLSLYVGISIGTHPENYKYLFFNLNSNINDESNPSNHFSILKINYYQLLSMNILNSQISQNIEPISISKYLGESQITQNNKNSDVINTKFTLINLTTQNYIKEADSLNLLEEFKMIWSINIREKYILVELFDLYSVHIQIELDDDLLRNKSIFPLLSYNHEHFDININYFYYKLSLKQIQELHNSTYNKGSKTLKKSYMNINRKSPGIPKRTTRLRPTGSTNLTSSIVDSIVISPHKIKIKTHKEKKNLNIRKLTFKKSLSQNLIKNKCKKKEIPLFKLRQFNYLFIDQNIRKGMRQIITKFSRYFLSKRFIVNCFNRVSSFFHRALSF